jgi:hypothetical protein
VLIDAAASRWKSSHGILSTPIWSTDATAADIAVGTARALPAVIDFPPYESRRRTCG